MRLNRLDLNLLVALDALLTERSITKAADRIHLSQPATSGALARLREYFDDKLLVRVGGSMVPTALGESLAEPIHNILFQIQVTVERGVEFSPQESERQFKLMCSDYTCSTLMTHVVRKMDKVAPNMQLEFFMPSDDAIAQLDKGRVDFMIMPSYNLAEDHPTSPLFSDEFVCLAWNENDAVTEKISAEEYLSMPQVGVRFGTIRNPTSAQVVLEEEYGMTTNERIVTATFNSIPEYLVGTGRIATIYRYTAEKWCEYLPLKYVPLPKGLEIPEVSWALQWHQFRDLDPGIQWMRELIVSVAQEELKLG